MSDDANDVAKALAAFGAPSIRYHSFGQAQIKPSSVVLPRRAAPPAPMDAQVDTQILTRQEEPVAAPEPAPARFVPPLVAALPLGAPPNVGPAPAPLIRQPEPSPTLAPPPRPLAEWAAPLTAATIRPIVAPAPLVRPSEPVPPMEVPVSARPSPPAVALPPLFPSATTIPQPAPPALVQHAPVQPSAMAPAPVPPAPASLPMRAASPAPAPTMFAATPSHVERNTASASQNAAGTPPSRNLGEIFEYLMSGPSKTGGRTAS